MRLLPCPFCGAKARMWKANRHTWIQCSNWNAEDDLDRHVIHISADTEEEAVAKWNHREPIPEDEALKVKMDEVAYAGEKGF